MEEIQKNKQIEAMKCALNPIMIFDPTEPERIKLAPSRVTGFGTEEEAPIVGDGGW